MKVKTKPVIQTFKLVSDDDGEATVSIRQARTGENLQLAELFAARSRVWHEGSGEVELRDKWNQLEIERKRAYLTLCGATNILDENDRELFVFQQGKNGPELAMTESAFNKAWGMLPTNVTDEISEYVLVVNPQWNPELQGE